MFLVFSPTYLLFHSSLHGVVIGTEAGGKALHAQQLVQAGRQPQEAGVTVDGLDARDQRLFLVAREQQDARIGRRFGEQAMQVALAGAGRTLLALLGLGYRHRGKFPFVFGIAARVSFGGAALSNARRNGLPFARLRPCIQYSMMHASNAFSMGDAMAMLTVRNLSDDVHRALRLRAAR